jgi:hypothetical protein
LASDLCLTLSGPPLIVSPRSKSKFLASYLPSGGRMPRTSTCSAVTRSAVAQKASNKGRWPKISQIIQASVQIEVLGILPAEWWKNWHKRLEWFNDEGELDGTSRVTRSAVAQKASNKGRWPKISQIIQASVQMSEAKDLERIGSSLATLVNLSTLIQRLGLLRRPFLSFSHPRPDSIAANAKPARNKDMRRYSI